MTDQPEDLYLHTTAEQDGDSFGHRVTREDRGDEEPEEALGQLVRPGGDAGEDDEASEVAFALNERDETLHDYPGEYDAVTAPEEAAMHLTDEPPMGDGDGYVDD
jgi:hypothetical protein